MCIHSCPDNIVRRKIVAAYLPSGNWETLAMEQLAAWAELPHTHIRKIWISNKSEAYDVPKNEYSQCYQYHTGWIKCKRQQLLQFDTDIVPVSNIKDQNIAMI